MNTIDGDYSKVIKGHAVIEASAGTGKTYTIEHLVLQILKDFKNIQISEILIVTFTDKAAGELKERVRTRLEKALADPAEAANSATFRAALEQFDSAAISTIHAFCNGILKEFPFENARPLELETGADSAIPNRLFNLIVRDEWAGLPERFSRAGSVVGRKGEIIRDKPLILQALKLRNHIISAACDTRGDDILLPSAPARLEDCATPEEMGVWTALELRRRIRDRRMASASITYDDMIMDVARALASEAQAGKRLLEILRRRYRFGLIDEFQDTDPDQWAIFRRIFVDGGRTCDATGNGNTLIVVGDPKQAIYRFRGADIKTYFDACDVLTSGHGSFYLGENHRSTPELIDGFNCMFSLAKWFADPVEKPVRPMEYRSSAAPADPGLKKTLALDLSGRGAVVPVWLSDGPSEETLTFGAGRQAFGNFMASEIRRLMDPATGVLLAERDDENSGRVLSRLPRFDDFCVLGRSAADIAVVSDCLARAGIPWAGYKQRTLYSSPEARHIGALMDFLAGTDDDERADTLKSVAFTRLFFPGGDLAALNDRARLDSIRKQLAGWRRLARERRWEMLFEAVVRQSGLFHREALEVDGERRLSNWRQIFEELVEAADIGSLDVRGLARHLSTLGVANGDGGDDSLISRLESEVPKVRLMTCHAAKGLQFPFVFVCGGFAGDKNDQGLVRCYDRKNRRCFVFSNDGQLGDDFVVDRDEKRLYYVALTRAVYKVYFPVGWMAAKGDSSVRKILSASMDALASARKGDNAVWTLVDAKGRLLNPFDRTVVNELPAGRDFVPAEHQNECEVPAFDLSPRKKIDWAGRRMRVDSYSSLAVRGSKAGSRRTAAPEGIREYRDDDDWDDGDDLTPPSEILLAAGKKTGTALHGIMEALAGGRSELNPEGFDFTTFCAAGSFEDTFQKVGGMIRLNLERHRIPNRQGRDSEGRPDGADRQMTRLVKNALQTSLGRGAPLNFSMSDVKPGDAVAEVEFHLDETSLSLPASPDAAGTDGIQRVSSGLLNGFIDLVFRKDGRYWFLDWKTTTIRPEGVASGPDGLVDEWAPAALDEAMAKHGYLVQAHVYRIAMLEWLTRIYGEKAPERFGGGLFLFVRGMDAPGRGVFNSIELFRKYSIEDSRGIILSRINGSGGGVDEQ